jgi:hypothetical protein
MGWVDGLFSDSHRQPFMVAFFHLIRPLHTLILCCSNSQVTREQMMIEFEYTTNTTEATVPGFKVCIIFIYVGGCGVCGCGCLNTWIFG